MPLAVAALCAFAVPINAQTNTDARTLFDLLAQPEFIQILSDEGHMMASDIAATSFSTSYLEPWNATVADLMDADRIEAVMFDQFVAATAQIDLNPFIDYFQNGYGAQTIAAEIKAREIMSDTALAERAIDMAYTQMPMGRFEQIDAFLDAAGYVDQSVALTLTDQFNFAMGLYEGGAIEGLSESDISAMVWQQEDMIRESTVDWFQGYLYLTFSDLSDDAIDDLIAFTQSEHGQTLNRVLLATQGDLFSEINRELGRQAAKFMIQTDL